MTEFFTTSDGYELAFYQLGPATSVSPPVIMQHGFSTSASHEWLGGEAARRLLQEGRRLIGLDARGHGKSAAPHDPNAYGERRMARDISDLADHLHLTSFDLAGYSMGAVISLLVAANDTRVRRLVVGGIGEAAVTLGGLDTRALDRAELAAALRTDDESGLSPFLIMVRGLAASIGNDILALAAVAEAIEGRPIELARISAPTLVLAGDVDPLASEPQILAAAIPGARLVMFPGAHEAAGTSEVFNREVVAFLQ